MNAEDIEVGMEVEAEFPEGCWCPAVVLRRKIARAGRSGDGLFNVRVTYLDGSTDIRIRHAGELRQRPIPAPAQVEHLAHHVRIVTADPSAQGYSGAIAPRRRPRPAEGQAVSRIAAAAGGSIAVWAAGAAVAIEVEVLLPRRSRSGPPRAGEIQPVSAQGILMPAGEAARMARSLRAGSTFYFAAPGAAIWIAPSHLDFAAAGAKATTWPDDGQPTVLVGRRAVALLAGLVESAAAEPSAARGSLDPDFGAWADLDSRYGNFRQSLLRAWQLTEKAMALNDPLAGARKRTDENLRKAFGC